MARPTIFKPEYVDQARKMAALGLVDKEMADVLGVGLRTFHRWKKEHPDFFEALKIAKDRADDLIEQALIRRAMGYDYPAQKIMQHAGKPVVVDYVEHVQPDTVALIFWLKNRRPEDWRDKRDVGIDLSEEAAAWLSQRQG